MELISDSQNSISKKKLLVRFCLKKKQSQRKPIIQIRPPPAIFSWACPLLCIPGFPPPRCLSRVSFLLTECTHNTHTCEHVLICPSSGPCVLSSAEDGSVRLWQLSAARRSFRPSSPLTLVCESGRLPHPQHKSRNTLRPSYLQPSPSSYPLRIICWFVTTYVISFVCDL